ncbi:hypothetical protein ABFS82_04G039700 [Erythranthe guttata]|uniref:transcription factor EMB1444-like n=1 Tax=Erythranthe guttata TaxID=4155 RepID=UPI00064D9400|nr:PREDICTED: transcription factor EMB1444-like [Erythranthe guttata]|eukprot:XP_012827706.1 PREDICTED: transcription factor EMB1444-like [Erythranthe guttata]
MESRLQQVLRSLCLKTGWKYAVFWKLKHRARMMLTWEDAYYDGNGYLDKKGFIETVGTTSEGAYSHDPLGLAMAKMPYEVYSLGEGVVGQVAVSGKHSWIFSDQHVADSSSSSGGWQTQFSAGVKTVAVVAVMPHGVVQLGSLDKIAEDLKLVDHIRNVFAELQDSLARYIPSSIISNTVNSSLPDTCTRIPVSTAQDCLPKLKGCFHEDEANLWSQFLSPNIYTHERDQCSFPGNEISLPSTSENTERPVQSNCSEMPISPFSFRAGYELYEALGPPFQKQYDHVWETEKKGPHMDADMSEGMESCDLLMSNYDSDMHLLDAVVAKVSQKGEGPQSELTAEKTPCNSMDTISMTGFSSTSSSTRGSTKTSKKRAKPGESCRPRPRDRQLIQDRIKELRELVPNGSKCSIDSLLERSIKHMIFLQSVTKHADKLHKCSASELLDKDTGMRRFSCLEQGSSWAVEVGNNQKVYPIIVENINMNGHMLVEMLCEECTMFLEIAETIRSLGLTILKGVSEAYGNKTWVCFVVENNRSMHRMDVLWSLMQLLQPKISN